MPSLANWSGAVKAIKSVGDLKGKLTATRKDVDEPEPTNSSEENIKLSSKNIKHVPASEALDTSNPRIRFEPPTESPPSPDPLRSDAKARKARRVTPYPGTLQPLVFGELASSAELQQSLRDSMISIPKGEASHPQKIQLTAGNSICKDNIKKQGFVKTTKQQHQATMSQHIDIFEALSEDPVGEDTGDDEMNADIER